MFIIHNILVIITVYPMSDLVRLYLITLPYRHGLIILLCIEVPDDNHSPSIHWSVLTSLLRNSCKANVWTQSASRILGLTAVGGGSDIPIRIKSDLLNQNCLQLFLLCARMPCQTGAYCWQP